MNSSIVNLIFLGVIAVFALVGVLKGLKGGLFKSIIGAACVVLSAVAAFIFTGCLSGNSRRLPQKNFPNFCRAERWANLPPLRRV